MAYDAGTLPQTFTLRASCAMPRADRIVLVCGGAAMGAIAGVGAAFALGRGYAWPLVFGAPLLGLAFWFACQTLKDAIVRRAYGCAAAAALVAMTLVSWPVVAATAPMSALAFWMPPMAALASMVLLASCWTGAQRAVYRLGGQAMFVATLAGFLGLNQLLS